ncbi:TlpA disulfide reductase family protein [Methylomonas sp. AM2-LC]|uniref:TlpA family protein disulfide reductase n=1 Tax=Methylomonas sp. AM2-LC TaxID=3153301 RepID=UPI003264DB0A
MKKTTLIMVLVGFLALTAGFLVKIGSLYQNVVETIKPLAFSFPDVEGHMQPLSQWQGKVLVVNFWATWCGPCLQEIPEFIKLQTEMQQQGLQFIGLAIDETADVKAFLQDVKVNYPILLANDTGMNLSMQMGNIVGAIPFTVIIDQEGAVIHRQMGELSREALQALVTPLLSKKI